jgi:type IV pilus assembly protein PilQ
MKIKQLLGVLILIVATSAMAAAAGSQLTAVSAKSEAGAAVVTIKATGAFTHTEYRPSENLLLVDLAGVSAAKFDSKAHLLQVPNVVGYKITQFKAASGDPVARVEFTLKPGAGVNVADGQGALLVKVTGTGAGASEVAAKSSAPAVVQANAHGKPATIQHIGVVRTKNGAELEVLASAAVTPQAMKLTQPDRIVLDVPNAVPMGKRELTVRHDAINTVRMSRYQVDPPVTRIVVDLAQAKDYELKTQGRRVTLRLHESQAASTVAPAPVAATPNVVAVATEAPVSTPAAAPSMVPTAPTTSPAVAQPLVVVEPVFKPKVEPSERAADAAAKFNPAKDDLSAPVSAALANVSAVNFMAPQAATGGSATPRKKYTGEPISVNLKDVDLKDFFRLIHEISGLNVILDPGVRGTVTLVLDDVPWDQALDIVLQNNGLDRQLDGNVLRIATVDTIRKEAEAKRAQLDAVALAVPKVTVVRFLSYAHSKDVVPTLKKFISARGEIISDDRTNSIIIEDIPATIPRVDDLIAKLDRKTPEVEIEGRVVAATRNFARDIGTQLGFGWGNSPTAVGGAPAVGSSPISNTTSGTPQYILSSGAAGGGSSIPLFSNLACCAGSPKSGLSFINADNNYRLDFILTMAESRGLLKILSRPRIVTQNNIQAVVRQGLRIPIVTQAQLGGPPTVQYVDAFLRLTVTPQITSEATIFLNVDVENTTPDFTRQVQGNPTLITQQATTQVLVTDGGTVVIGGVVQTQNQVTVDQVPLLGDIPVLGYLFKRRNVTTQTQELIFFITPKIIQT